MRESERVRPQRRVLYFGCWGGTGHYLWRPSREYLSWEETKNIQPWGGDIDGGLTPRTSGSQGAGAFHQKDGWSALAMHDYTVDGRPGSSSTFLVSEEMSEEELRILARESFPEITARLWHER